MLSSDLPKLPCLLYLAYYTILWKLYKEALLLNLNVI